MKWVQEIVNKVEEDKEWAFDVVATTEDADRENEIIKVNWWDIKNWQMNPVVLANHDYTIENIIGKGTSFYTSNGIKRLKGVFSKTNPLWILARDLYNEGMLKSVSVGFIPLKRNEQDYKIIEKAELLEVSFVAVPCNPNAVSLDGKLYEEAITKWLIKEVVEEIIEEVEEKELTIKDLHNEIQEIKTILNAMADDKVKAQELDAEVQKAKEQKEFLQQVNKATATALENLKKLY